MEWVTFEQSLTLKMPYSSKYVVKHYLETGRFTNLLYGGIADKKGVKFDALEDFPDTVTR